MSIVIILTGPGNPPPPPPPPPGVRQGTDSPDKQSTTQDGATVAVFDGVHAVDRARAYLRKIEA